MCRRLVRSWERHASAIRLGYGGWCPPSAFVQKGLSIPSNAADGALVGLLWLRRLGPDLQMASLVN